MVSYNVIKNILDMLSENPLFYIYMEVNKFDRDGEAKPSFAIYVYDDAGEADDDDPDWTAQEKEEINDLYNMINNCHDGRIFYEPHTDNAWDFPTFDVTIGYESSDNT